MPHRELSDVVDELLGKPFRLGARGPDAFDCFGLVGWLYREVYGIEIPDPTHAGSVGRIHLLFDHGEIGTPSPGDIWHWRSDQRITKQHVAIYEGPRIVEATTDGGIRRAWPESMSVHGQVKCYRLKPERRLPTPPSAGTETS